MPFQDQNDPNDWRASLDIHGSPGRNDEPNTNIDRESDIEIINYDLAQNYPNPFNNHTMINYSIPKKSNVKLEIYDITGRRVATLVDEIKKAGKYFANFNGSNLSTGIYVYILTTEYNSLARTMILIK